MNMARSVVGVLVSSLVGCGEGLRVKLEETLDHLDGDVLGPSHEEDQRRELQQPTQLWRGVNKW